MWLVWKGLEKEVVCVCVCLGVVIFQMVGVNDHVI